LAAGLRRPAGSGPVKARKNAAHHTDGKREKEEEKGPNASRRSPASKIRKKKGRKKERRPAPLTFPTSKRKKKGRGRITWGRACPAALRRRKEKILGGVGFLRPSQPGGKKWLDLFSPCEKKGGGGKNFPPLVEGERKATWAVRLCLGERKRGGGGKTQ